MESPSFAGNPERQAEAQGKSTMKNVKPLNLEAWIVLTANGGIPSGLLNGVLPVRASKAAANNMRKWLDGFQSFRAEQPHQIRKVTIKETSHV